MIRGRATLKIKEFTDISGEEKEPYGLHQKARKAQNQLSSYDRGARTAG